MSPFQKDSTSFYPFGFTGNWKLETSNWVCLVFCLLITVLCKDPALLEVKFKSGTFAFSSAICVQVSSDCQVGKSWKVILFKCQVLFKPVFHFWTKLNPEDFFDFFWGVRFHFHLVAKPLGFELVWWDFSYSSIKMITAKLTWNWYMLEPQSECRWH